MKNNQVVDELYDDLHRRYESGEALSDGYRYKGYFAAEQKILLSLVSPTADVTVDVGCGSGLMIKPLCVSRAMVVGIDFNFDACSTAARNGITAVRGDAFCLPLKADSVDEIVTCQAFNTQDGESVERFVTEASAVLRPNGRLIMVWRNGTALVHRMAFAGLTVVDKMLGRPCFPLKNHAIAQVAGFAESAGLIVERRMVSFPPLGWTSINTGGLPAKIIGASAICVARKPALAE